MTGSWLGMQTTPVPNRRFVVRGNSVAMNIMGEGIGSLVAEKCSPSHNSLKPSLSASSDFSVSSASVSVKERAGGCTGIMKNPRRMFPPIDERLLTLRPHRRAPLLDSIVTLAQCPVKGRKYI